MLDRCTIELASLKRAQQRADEADDFRIAGEAIYTYLSEIPERAEAFVTPDGLVVALDPTSTAKANAASYFKRFKKARSGLPQIAKRIATLEGNRTFWEDLVWQLERAQTAKVDDLTTVCDEIADAIGYRKGTVKRRSAKKPTTRSVELPGGAIAHVGKSPKDNERVTFSVGGPNDLWFHARGVPGAHVILKLRDAGERATDEQILAAAALAAGQSRAAEAGKVDVDYTARKHVRKQGGGRVGLVWYTDNKTVLVQPRKLPI
jgi:predicted ribosome quality control (RQC) complex YloA/Tae2 family protein